MQLLRNENMFKVNSPTPVEEKTDNQSHLIRFAEENLLWSLQEVEDLQHQLGEMHQEIEKLLGLI